MFSEIGELFFSILVSYMGALEFLFVVRQIYHWSFQHNGRLITLSGNSNNDNNEQNDNDSLQKLQEHLRNEIVVANEKELFGLKAMKDGMLYNDGFRVDIDKETSLKLSTNEELRKMIEEIDKNENSGKKRTNLKDDDPNFEKKIVKDMEVSKKIESELLEEVCEEPCIKKKVGLLFDASEQDKLGQLVDSDNDIDVDIDIDNNDEPITLTQTVKTQMSQSYNDKYSLASSPKMDSIKSEEDSSSLEPTSSNQMSSLLTSQPSSSIDTTLSIPEMQFDEYEGQAPDGEDIASPQYSDDYLRNLDGIKHRPLVRDDGTGRRRAFKKRRSSGSSTSSRDSRLSREEELKMFTSLEEEECERIRKERSPTHSTNEQNLKVSKPNKRHRRSPAKDAAPDSNRNSLERLNEEDSNPWGELKPELYKNTEFWKREKTLSIEEEFEDAQRGGNESFSPNMIKTSSFEEATPSQHENVISTLAKQQSNEIDTINKENLRMNSSSSMPTKSIDDEVNVSTNKLSSSIANTSIASTNDFSSALPIDKPNPQDAEEVIVACNQNDDHTDSSPSTGGLRRSPRVDEIDHYEERWEMEEQQRSTTTSPAVPTDEQLIKSDQDDQINQKNAMQQITGSNNSVHSLDNKIEDLSETNPIIEIDFVPEDSKFHLGIEDDDDDNDNADDEYSDEIIKVTGFKENLCDYSELNSGRKVRESRSMSPSIGRSDNDSMSPYLRKSPSPTRIDPNTLGTYSPSRSFSSERRLSPTIQIDSPSDSSRSVSPPISTSVSDSNSRCLSQEIQLSPTIEIEYAIKTDSQDNELLINDEDIDNDSELEEDNQRGRLLEGISDFYDFNASVNPKRSLRSHTPSLQKKMMPSKSYSRSPSRSPTNSSLLKTSSNSSLTQIQNQLIPSTSGNYLKLEERSRSRSHSLSDSSLPKPISNTSSSEMLQGISDFYDFNVRLNQSIGIHNNQQQIHRTSYDHVLDELQLSKKKTISDPTITVTESKNEQPSLQENEGGTKKIDDIRMLMASPSTPDYDRSFSEEWTQIEEIKSNLLAGAYVRSTYVGESMDLSDQFEDLRQQTRDFKRSRSKSRSPRIDSHTPIAMTTTKNQQQNDKKQLQEKILNEITKTTLNFQEFSNNLKPNYLDYDRRSSDSALIQKPEILIQIQDTARQDLTDDEIMLNCLEDEEYHHYRRFSLHQDYQINEDYDEYISQIEVRTKDGTKTWTRSNLFDGTNDGLSFDNLPTIEKEVCQDEQTQNDIKTSYQINEEIEDKLDLNEWVTDMEELDRNESPIDEHNLVQDNFGDGEEFGEDDSNSDDERQTVVEVDDGIDEEIWDFTDRPEESNHEQSECEEAEREMDRYANHDINDWKEDGAIGGGNIQLNDIDNNDDDLQIDQIYDDAIKDRKQSGILRDYDSLLNDIQTDTEKQNIEPTEILLDEILHSDDHDQYSILSPRSIRNSRGSSRESSKSFLETERGENERRYLGDAWESAIQSTRLRSRYKIAPAAPFVNYDELDEVNTNYVPKKEYKWRKNFRLDDDNDNNNNNANETIESNLNIEQNDDRNDEIEIQFEENRRFIEERKFSLGGESITLFSRSPERSTNGTFNIPEGNEDDLANRDYENEFENYQATAVIDDQSEYLSMDQKAAKKIKRAKKKSKRDSLSSFDGLDYLSISRRGSIGIDPNENLMDEDSAQIEIKKKSKRKSRRGSAEINENENSIEFDLSRKNSIVECNENDTNDNDDNNQLNVTENLTRKKIKKKRKSREQIDIDSLQIENENDNEMSQQITELSNEFVQNELTKVEKKSKRKSKHSKTAQYSTNNFDQQLSSKEFIDLEREQETENSSVDLSKVTISEPHSSKPTVDIANLNASIPTEAAASSSLSSSSLTQIPSNDNKSKSTKSLPESSDSYYLIKDASLYPLI